MDSIGLERIVVFGWDRREKWEWWCRGERSQDWPMDKQVDIHRQIGRIDISTTRLFYIVIMIFSP